jgi:uncharacterized protein
VLADFVTKIVRSQGEAAMEITSVRLEIKNLSKREFDGHGSTFGNLDLGGDIVMPGAFAKTLADHRNKGTLPQLFWMHNPDQVPGKWLEMSEDETGLAVKGVLADTQLGNEMHTLLGMDAVRGLSIGYRTKDYEWDREGNRLLKEIELWEVSLVSLAMNPMAQVEHMKARLSGSGEYVPTEREFEQKLRSMSCSKNVARQCVSKLFEHSPGGGMLAGDRDRWDAGNIETAANDLLASMNRYADAVGAEAIRRR